MHKCRPEGQCRLELFSQRSPVASAAKQSRLVALAILSAKSISAGYRFTLKQKASRNLKEVGRGNDQANRAHGSHQSPSGCRFTTRGRLRIMNRPAASTALSVRPLSIEWCF
jgi:hypothetical protein